jgi:organic radical activating enzyme
MEEDLITRLRKRANIRKQIPTRKSVQENRPDKIADLLEEAAKEIESLNEIISDLRTDLFHAEVLVDINRV